MKRLLVMGSANVDITLEMERVPLGGECLMARSVRRQIGGKGVNQAVAAARLQTPVTFVGKVGHDEDGQAVERLLKAEGAETCLLRSSSQPTGTAYILLEENHQNRIIVHGGANQDYTNQDVDRIKELIDEHDAFLLQLETSMEAIRVLIDYAVEQGKRVIVDAGPALPGLLPMFRGVDVISPNETELATLTGIDETSEEAQTAACRMLLEAGAKAVLLKRGDKGSLWLTEEEHWVIPACPGVAAVDTTGAGDAFTAAFANRMVQGASVSEALTLATAAGAAAVTRMGAMASMPHMEALMPYLCKGR